MVHKTVNQKTFKIGEYAKGGIIRVFEEANGDITIEAKDWDTKAVILTRTMGRKDVFAMQQWLEELTTSYYAEKVMTWITRGSVDD